MGKILITDQALKQAAGSVREAMLNAVLPEEVCRHEFSPEFEEKIRHLQGKKRRRQQRLTIARRVAAIFLAIVLGAGIWLASNDQARAAVARWIREVNDNSIVYRFFGDAPTEENFFYELTWVPEGYEIIDQVGVDSTQIIVYQKESDVFTFTYHRITEGSLAQLLETSGEGVSVSINGIIGQYYEAADSDTTNGLIWINEDTGIFYCILSFLPYEDIVHMAESVKLSPSPK